jgi:hypothetical protein
MKIAVIVWLATPYRASQDALTLLKSTDTYTFSNSGNLEFIPKEQKDIGVIFYPGGRVEAASYSYLCVGIADQGYPCVITIMPLNLAVTKINAADEVITKYPQVTKWVVGGHSLGGSMIARYVQGHSDKIKALFLLGAYSDIDISKLSISAEAFVGTEDAILDANTFTADFKNLPKGTNINMIQGGNHSQYGDYGHQEGDGDATISKDEQHKAIVTEVLKLIAN